MRKIFLFIAFLSVIHGGIEAQQRVTSGSAINITEAPRRWCEAVPRTVYHDRLNSVYRQAKKYISHE